MSKQDIIHWYEELDALRCEATALAERKCRKLRTGQVAFSPELNLSRFKIKAWLLLIDKYKKREVSSRFLKRTLKRANLSNKMRSLSEEELQERLKDEYKLYYQLKGEAGELRMTALENLALAIAEKGIQTRKKFLGHFGNESSRGRQQERLSFFKVN